MERRLDTAAAEVPCGNSRLARLRGEGGRGGPRQEGVAAQTRALKLSLGLKGFHELQRAERARHLRISRDLYLIPV